MKKNKIILSIITILTLMISTKVEAWTQNGTISVISNHSDYGINFPRLSGDDYNYHTNSFSVNFKSKSYTAYCLDPGFNLSDQQPVDCEPADITYAALAWLINEAVVDGKKFTDLDYNTQLLAVRMLAIYTGKNLKVGNMGGKHPGTEIVSYVQARDNDLENTSGNPDDYMIMTNDNARNTVETAYRFANEARYHTDYNSNSNGTIDMSLSAIITKSTQEANKFDNYYEANLEVYVSAHGNIDPTKIKYECENCEVVNVFDFGTTSSYNSTTQLQSISNHQRVTIRVSSPNCSYKLKVRYDGKVNSNRNALYNCKPRDNKNKIQNFLALIPENDVSVDANETLYTWEEKITSSNGGNYFQNYCANPNECVGPDCDPNTGECVGPDCYPVNKNELICNQQTTYKPASFCDDDNDQEITITAPTDIAACILKEEDDAGNSYVMAGFEENKYCSVSCKEDYQMTMPGAQYANSGRYFELKNVLVKGTKTCYTSSPTSVKDDTKTNIDIQQFINDIISAQKNLVDKYNAYLLQVAKKAKKDDTNYVDSSTTSGCASTATGTWHKLKTFNYTGKDITCNAQTGQCTLSDKTFTYTAQTDDEWGTSYSTTKPCIKYYPDNVTCQKEGSCSETSTNKSEPNWDKAISDAKEAVDEANNNIKNIIAQFSSCYNWETNYCFEPEVSFDYQEQYSKDIRFGQVSSKVVNNTSVEGFDKIKNDNYETDAKINANESYDYLGFDNNGNLNFTNSAKNISTLQSPVYYIKKVATGEAEYNNQQSFQTNYPHGTIDTVSDQSSLRYNYSYLGAKFPIAMKTEFGVYNWTLKFEKIGQYMDQTSCSNGRLNDVIKEIDNSNLDTDIGYACVYVVDCPECDFTCECPDNLMDGYTCLEKPDGINGKYCAIIPPCDDGDCSNECYGPDCVYDPPCEGPDCGYQCVGAGCNFCTDGEYPCILTTDEKYIYRSVSLNELFPNNRAIGANWSNSKGTLAKSNIEQSGENAYINASYSFKLTAENMRNIRLRNQALGNYVDGDGLQYYSQNGITNFYGKSKFLDEGDKLGYFKTLKRSTVWNIYPGSTSNGIGPAWN